MSGRFTVFEGGDGSGKSSVLRALGDGLRDAGVAHLLTREPGGTPLGERIRAILLEQHAVGDPLSELLLFEAARARLVETVIRPALDAGHHVICDRFTPSSIAYQSYGRGLPREVVESANAIATAGLEPDDVVLLDVPAELGLARRAGEGQSNHFDLEAAAFHERVRRGYLDMAREDPGRWHVIDASQPLHDVVQQAWRITIAL